MPDSDRPISGVLYAEDLVRRIRANEPDAFDELYTRYSPRVFSYLYRQLDGNAEEAEDLTAEVFAGVHETIDGYQSRGAPLSAWLFRIARNRLIDALRRRPRQTPVPLELAPALPAGPVLQPVDQAVAREQIARGLARLTPEQRQVIVLRFLEGKSLAETARLVDRGEDAVKKLQRRGLLALRRQMECLSGCWRVPLDPAS